AITGQDILNMLDTGTGSVLVVLADSGDQLDLDAINAAGETCVETPQTGYTQYAIFDGSGEIAQIHWYAA
ncbi:MAG: hypothetical protein RQ723_10400, partial [Desulfuromonadales bacterium]|nr:hypothetical protein [Desulfuromonadales bacterium]